MKEKTWRYSREIKDFNFNFNVVNSHGRYFRLPCFRRCMSTPYAVSVKLFEIIHFVLTSATYCQHSRLTHTHTFTITRSSYEQHWVAVRTDSRHTSICIVCSRIISSPRSALPPSIEWLYRRIACVCVSYADLDVGIRMKRHINEFYNNEQERQRKKWITMSIRTPEKHI